MRGYRASHSGISATSLSHHLNPIFGQIPPHVLYCGNHQLITLCLLRCVGPVTALRYDHQIGPYRMYFVQCIFLPFKAGSSTSFAAERGLKKLASSSDVDRQLPSAFCSDQFQGREPLRCVGVAQKHDVKSRFRRTISAPDRLRFLRFRETAVRRLTCLQ
jgi:hypothetical protein